MLVRLLGLSSVERCRNKIHDGYVATTDWPARRSGRNRAQRSSWSHSVIPSRVNPLPIRAFAADTRTPEWRIGRFRDHILKVATPGVE
jgi:hypothetical protein